jgi:hypothetical protein
MLKVLETAFLNPNRVREANIEYRKLIISITDTFIDFKTQFLLLAEEAGIPQSSRRLDLYNKLTVDLQTSLIPVLSTLTTRVHFSDSQARSPTPLADSKVIYYNCGRPGHYAAAYTNPQKPSADLSKLERAIE